MRLPRLLGPSPTLASALTLALALACGSASGGAPVLGSATGAAASSSRGATSPLDASPSLGATSPLDASPSLGATSPLDASSSPGADPFRGAVFSSGAAPALGSAIGVAASAPVVAAATGIRAADPSVLRVGGNYVSVQAIGSGLHVRQAGSPAGLAAAPATRVFQDTQGLGEVWAPEIHYDGGRYLVYFTMGTGAAHRMYVISSTSPAGGYGAATRMSLPDDRWAIDGTMFTFNGQRWFVWSGWAGTTNVEQNLYIARMSSPTTTTGGRYVISQPRESWERVVGNPFINEAPEAIKDPGGQLHIVYSANGSWSDQYCLADLRLRAGGDPTNVWDWYKSNGCLFGSNRGTMMAGWDPTLTVNGPGHYTFVLLNGDINTSPPAGSRFPSMFHAVPKGTPYTWANRSWYTGTFMWWGTITYSRTNVPGAPTDTGWSLKFFE